jgi:hypothetical protein
MKKNETYISKFLQSSVSIQNSEVTYKSILHEIRELNISISLSSGGNQFLNEKSALLITESIIKKEETSRIQVVIDAVIKFQSNPVLRKYLAYLFYLLKQNDEAITLASTSLSINHDDPASLMVLGLALNSSDRMVSLRSYASIQIERQRVKLRSNF